MTEPTLARIAERYRVSWTLDTLKVASNALFPNSVAVDLSTVQPRFCVAVDAEEDFDWTKPVPGTNHSTACMRNVGLARSLFRAYGVVPVYLLTYPVLGDREATLLLERQIERGECEVGLQLHPWATPPFDRSQEAEVSYFGGLSGDHEERKLVTLVNAFRHRFGFQPRIYRAGRYGVSRNTARLLEEYGFDIDTSVAPRTTFTAEGGPDFTEYEADPFWFGVRRRILELPLCRSVVGWGGSLAPGIYRVSTTPRIQRARIAGALARSQWAERITLSPEGNDFRAMQRLVRRLAGKGQRIFVISFHSSSLLVGSNPYVRCRADLHAFYDRLSAILHFLMVRQGMKPASLSEVRDMLLAGGH